MSVAVEMFALCGLTFVVTHSEIAAPLRSFFGKRSEYGKGNSCWSILFKLSTCPQCLGFWAGFLVRFFTSYHLLSMVTWGLAISFLCFFVSTQEKAF